MTERLAPVAVDAMGGDHAPGAIVQGAINAARKGLPVVLVGPEALVRQELHKHHAPKSLPITVHNATEVVDFHDHPGQAVSGGARGDRCKWNRGAACCANRSLSQRSEGR